MTKKKKTTAQPATDTKPDRPLPEPEKPESPATEEEAAPVDRIALIEATLAEHKENFEVIANYLKDRDAKLAPLVGLAEQLAQRQQAAVENPQAQPKAMGGIMDLMPVLLQALTSGGGGNSIGDQLTQKVMEAGVKQLTMGIDLTQALTTKVLADLGAKTATKIAEGADTGPT